MRLCNRNLAEPLQKDDTRIRARVAQSRKVLPFSTPFSAYSDDAMSIVILPALSDFAKGGRRICFKPAEACLPQAEISPAFLCVLCVSAVIIFLRFFSAFSLCPLC
jgi:hypothetical protein